MNVNCLSCGHWLDLRDGYDDYTGQIRCFICGCLLAIRSEDGQVKSVEMAANPRRSAAHAPVKAE
jgi:hypothetical protein